MRSLRKALGSFVASVIACASLMAVMPAVSATYDNCDVNRDGYVNTSDLILLNQYLNGVYSVSNYNQLDVNRSLTVDAADYECLSAKILDTTYSWSYLSRDLGTFTPGPYISGFTPDGFASSTNSRSYTKYFYEGENAGTTSTYTLTPTIGNLNSGNTPRQIVGTDDRYRLDFGEEYSGIVKLGGGTGFIIDDHHIVTAAHCVYGSNGWNDLTGNLYYNDGFPDFNTPLTFVEVHVPTMYFQAQSNTIEQTKYDYALITVEEDLSEYDLTYFSLGNSYNITESNYANIPLYVTGIPGSTASMENNRMGLLFTGEGRVSSNSNNQLLHYTVDTSSGNSGGPVYTITANFVGGERYYTYTALAIHAGYVSNVENHGSLITKYHLQFFKNNPYALY